AGVAGKCPNNTAPIIVSEPAPQTAVVGRSAIFTVGAIGTPPLSYQWSSGAGVIDGATSSSLTLTNVQMSQSGTSFYATITNALGSTNSSSAALTVVPAPPCTNAPSGLVSWWPAEASGADVASANSGTLQGGMAFGS